MIPGHFLAEPCRACILSSFVVDEFQNISRSLRKESFKINKTSKTCAVIVAPTISNPSRKWLGTWQMPK